MSKKKMFKNEDMKEMQQVYDFYEKYKFLLVSIVILIGVGIFGYNWYQESKKDSILMASTRLFNIQSDFDKGNFERVIADGIVAEKEFKGEVQGGNILMLVAKAYSHGKKYDEGIDFLTARISSYSKNDIISYGLNNILAGFYVDKWNSSGNKNFALKAAKTYEKCVELSYYEDALEAAYNSAQYYVIVGDNKKAKNILSNYYEVNTVSFGIKGKINKLYQKL